MINWLKQWFTKPATKLPSEQEGDEACAYIVTYIDTDGNLKIDLDFDEDSSEAFAYLFYMFVSGGLAEGSCTVFTDTIDQKDKPELGKEIMEIVNTLLVERAAELSTEIPEDLENYVLEDEEEPLVDPCNVFSGKGAQQHEHPDTQ